MESAMNYLKECSRDLVVHFYINLINVNNGYNRFFSTSFYKMTSQKIFISV